MSKWLFILKECFLYITLMVIVYSFVHSLMYYFKLSMGMLPEISIFGILSTLLFPALFFIHSIIKLIRMGVDFDQEINQSGAIQLERTFDLGKEDLAEAFRKREAAYTILHTNEDNYIAEYTIQYKKDINTQISIRLNRMEKRKTNVVFRVNELETNFSMFPAKSKNWRENAKYLSHFYDLFIDYEIEFVRSALREKKLSLSMNQV